jgi:hypothetical protein
MSNYFSDREFGPVARTNLVIFLVRFPFANLVEHEEEAIEDSVSWLSKKIRGW